MSLRLPRRWIWYGQTVMLVVDACAVAAILFAEPDADEVVKRIDGVQLVAPSLLWYELASVCLKKIAAQPRASKKLLEAFSLLERLNISVVSIDHHESVQLARENRLTAYDASYLWLARYLRVEIVTLDQRLQRVAGRK